MLGFAIVGAPREVVEAIDRRFDASVSELVELARIPGVSASGFPERELERSAEAVAALLTQIGLDGVEILRAGDAAPSVVAESLGA